MDLIETSEKITIGIKPQVYAELEERIGDILAASKENSDKTAILRGIENAKNR